MVGSVSTLLQSTSKTDPFVRVAPVTFEVNAIANGQHNRKEKVIPWTYPTKASPATRSVFSILTVVKTNDMKKVLRKRETGA